ncbi:mandelate racemase/muconate lactonizing enzyme family protein [Runella slithyformis]|uniref:Mandelate racemase/muconate lactonizing protein n=1 Tax=Runella slithyformis (strain ATCC 29530 / DSM 19594 / LMG 11500 / NCIMB 11436 / LSU 4) TaxID=761193 RepID=A0A7U3ZGQ3_RUNSL|nr:mandelate racemase/muconate lactonizing enzyme family protein [Runella slithyformis]AEI46880.1 Mandelate racemase/muconate lactonizing protein [Runella slithyformis DSM 19594]
MLNRRNFLKTGLLAAAFPVCRTSADTDELPHWPLPNLKALFPEIIKLESVELLKTQGELMLVVRANGQLGITQCNDRMHHLTSLLKGLVLPHFAGKDARDLPQLVDNAYRLNSNYKYAGMPLWNCIGSVEIAVWDVLGKILQQPVYQLLGKPVRSEYPVYISDFNREGNPEKIADQLLEKLTVTGANGVKIKVGGRMVNTPENAAQTRKYIPMLRKVLGNEIIMYADANGSYTPREGIETGKLLEDNGVAIFEEPCNFEDEEGMKTVTKALSKIMLAGGEQDSSLYRFRRLARENVYDLLQPDMYYNGGILRTLQVAEIAKKYGAVGIAPHTPKADPLIAPFWQVAALIPNLYGLQEFVYNPTEKKPTWHTDIRLTNGKMTIPDRAGLGINYDASIWQSAERIV